MDVSFLIHPPEGIRIRFITTDIALIDLPAISIDRRTRRVPFAGRRAFASNHPVRMPEIDCCRRFDESRVNA